MEKYTPPGEKDANEDQLLDESAIDSSEEGFMKGYSDDEEIEECDECASALNIENTVVRTIDDEKYKFCSKLCADEFEENLH